MKDKECMYIMFQVTYKNHRQWVIYVQHAFLINNLYTTTCNAFRALCKNVCLTTSVISLLIPSVGVYGDI